MQSLLVEIQRRKVFNTFLPYVGFVWLFLQVISVVSPMLNLSPLVNTFSAVLLFAGIPVMLYLSWYFNFTTDGLEAIPDAKTGVVRRFGVIRWAIFLSIVTVSGYLGFSYFYTVKVELAKSSQGASQQMSASSIVVIPFSDNSAEQEQYYLAQGLAEEIAALLGSSSKLRVIAASSINVLVEQGLDPISIARRLKVETALTGTLRRVGNNIRLRVELLNVKDGKILWSESYSQKFTDIFALESTIARATVNTLIEEFITVDEFNNPSLIKNADAYDMYLRGRAAHNKKTIQGLKDARKYFEQSIAIEPEYSQAYVALADTIILSADRTQNFEILEPDIAKTLAQRYLAKALIKTQALPEAFAVQGKVFELDGQLDNALASFNKAIQINPSLAIAHRWKYTVLLNLGRTQDGFEALKKAIKLDPESITLRYKYAIELNQRQQLAEADAVFKALVKDYPASPLGYAGLAVNYYNSGKLSKSYQSWLQAYKISPNNEDYNYRLRLILLNLGLTEEMLKFDDDASFTPYVLLSNNEYEKLNELMLLKREAHPQDALLQFESIWFEAQTGNYTNAPKVLAFVDESLSVADKYAMPSCSPAIEIAWSYLLSAKEVEAQSIINACAKKLKQYLGSGIKVQAADYLALRIAALKSDPNEVAILLGKLIKQGYRESSIFNDPLLDKVKGLPEIQALLTTLAGLIAQERIDLQNYLASLAIENG